MGKSSNSAPSPDPNIGRAALKQAETGQQWLDFARDSFKVTEARQVELDALTKRVSELQIGLGEDAAKWSREDRKRYDEVFKPLEDEFIKEAGNYATEERQTEAAAEAKADVQASAAGVREASARNAASMGLDPTSGRYAGMERANDMGIALSEAGAANNARQAVRDKGLALKADVVNLGKGLPAQAAGGVSTSVGAGASGVGMSQATNGQYMAATGIMNQGFAGAMQGHGGMANTLNQQYSNQLNAWKAQQDVNSQNSAGIGKALGGVAGFFMSDENLKEDKQEIPEGEALDAIEQMRVEKWKYKDGVEDSGEHVGTYAQDFTAATGQGDGQKIAVQDAIGVTMKAVKDLSAKFDKLSDAVGLGQGSVKKSTNQKPRQQSPAIGIGAFA